MFFPSWLTLYMYIPKKSIVRLPHPQSGELVVSYCCDLVLNNFWFNRFLKLCGAFMMSIYHSNYNLNNGSKLIFRRRLSEDFPWNHRLKKIYSYFKQRDISFYRRYIKNVLRCKEQQSSRTIPHTIYVMIYISALRHRQ